MLSKAHQGYLEQVIRSTIFPAENIITNARNELQLKNPETGQYLELDVWLPDLQIGFEFQDLYHFKTAWYRHSPLAAVQENDEKKRAMLQKLGITLILIPCWWDTQVRSLTSEICFHRPDVKDKLPIKHSHPVSLNPSESFFPPYTVPDVGEVMLASFVGSSTRVASKLHIEPWWLGEKYDGIHFLLNPIQQELYNRRGQPIPFHDSIVNVGVSTNVVLDGEIWFGRRSFHQSQQIYKGELELELWAYLRMIPFDIAALCTQRLTYEQRYESLITSLPLDLPSYIYAARMLCKSSDQLRSILKELLLKSGGEGIILQKPKSLYEQGRSNSLLKIKGARGDSEALVVRVARTYISVQLPTEQRIRIPKENISEGLHLKEGDIVTMQYDNMYRDIPNDPVVTRVRTDVLWETICKEASRVQPKKDVLSMLPNGYWTNRNGANLRSFFYEVASSKGLDPLNPQTWYTLTYTLLKKEGANLSFLQSRGGFFKTLFSIFPDIGLETNKFKTPYYMNVHNRRKFLDQYAKEQGFDPLIVENWYRINLQHLLSMKGARAVASYHGGGIKTTIRQLYPELKINPTKYEYQAEYYLSMKRRREFFTEFAHVHGFDPLVPDNWYTIARERILQLKNTEMLKTFYQRQFVKALMDIFPEIGLERSQFVHISSQYWADPQRQRKFFNDFAKENGFDPLDPDKWYTVPRTQILTKKGANPIINHYQGNYAKALVNVYPDLKLELNKFGIMPSGYWNELQNRKEFFNSFAQLHGFDPLVAENWYNISQQQILETKNSRVVLSFYQGNFINALLSVYPDIGLDKLKFSAIPKEFWHDRENRREFFNALAQHNGFDPLVSSNWYSLPKLRVIERRGSSYILSMFDSNYIKAIINAYPDLSLDEKKFEFLPPRYWADANKRKAFFDSFAKANGFDPLVANNWHSVTKSSISKFNPRHSSTIFSYHNGSFMEALLSLYPNIGINRAKFKNLPSNHFQDHSNRKRVFDDFAKESGFDPLIADNWYKIKKRHFMRHKSGETVLNYYGDNIGKALVHLYPDIGLQLEKFSFGEGYWESFANRQAFMNKYAAQKGFDPLLPENWYNLDRRDFIKSEKVGGLLQYYQKSVQKALLELYPNIGLDPHKFKYHKSGHWCVEENRRKLFDEFAQENNFDPLIPDNWYRVTRATFVKKQYTSWVLDYYTSFADALLKLYPHIGLDPTILSRPKNYWKQQENQKEFFEAFARRNGFDYLIPTNWYSISQQQILEQKDASQVLSQYHNNYVEALQKIFPNIGLNATKFSHNSNFHQNTISFKKEKFDPSLAVMHQLFPDVGNV